MARGNTWSFRAHTRKKRKGVHSKNASVGQTGFKKKYRGQGRQCPRGLGGNVVSGLNANHQDVDNGELHPTTNGRIKQKQ